MANQHPITPPPELIQQWWKNAEEEHSDNWDVHAAVSAARWGADQELEACCGKSKATKHGLHRSPEYCAWEHMKQRCYNPNSKNYHLYGGRGIRVCAEWFHDFSIFYTDMGPRPSPGYSIDRIDVNEHYKPENCRWATHKQQARNRRSSTLVEVEGKMVSLAEAAEITGISRKTLSTRICRGWTGEKLLSPVAQILSFSHAERGDA
jgi:hypothetical protein